MRDKIGGVQPVVPGCSTTRKFGFDEVGGPLSGATTVCGGLDGSGSRPHLNQGHHAGSEIDVDCDASTYPSLSEHAPGVGGANAGVCKFGSGKAPLLRGVSFNPQLGSDLWQGKAKFLQGSHHYQPQAPESMFPCGFLPVRPLGNSVANAREPPQAPVGSDFGSQRLVFPSGFTPPSSEMDQGEGDTGRHSNVSPPFWPSEQSVLGPPVVQANHSTSSGSQFYPLLVCGRHSSFGGDTSTSVAAPQVCFAPLDEARIAGEFSQVFHDSGSDHPLLRPNATPLRAEGFGSPSEDQGLPLAGEEIILRKHHPPMQCGLPGGQATGPPEGGRQSGGVAPPDHESGWNSLETGLVLCPSQAPTIASHSSFDQECPSAVDPLSVATSSNEILHPDSGCLSDRVGGRSHLESGSTSELSVDNTPIVYSSGATETHNMEGVASSNQVPCGVLATDSTPMRFAFTVRCHNCRRKFQQRVQQVASERANSSSENHDSPSPLLCSDCAFTGENQCFGRPVESESGRGKRLRLSARCSDTSVSGPSDPSHCGHVCIRPQPSAPQVLGLETIPLCRKNRRLRPVLGQNHHGDNVLLPPMATHSASPHQGSEGQGSTSHVSPVMGGSPMVATISEDQGRTPFDPSRASVFGDQGPISACTEVAHLLQHSELLLSAALGGRSALPGSGALRILHLAENASDIPQRIRLSWLENLLSICPLASTRVALIKRRLRRSATRSKYDLFYDPTPLVSFYKSGELQSMTVNMLRDKLIVALRIHTMGRSADLAHLLPNLWEHQGILSCRFFDKTGRHRLLALSGRPLSLFLVYLMKVSDIPAPFLLRFEKDFSRCLGSEAIAKVALHIMQECGIDTNLFKAHSMRGAAATAFMAAGIDQCLTRQRGGWSDTTAFEAHYARLHQIVPWDDCLSTQPDSPTVVCSSPRGIPNSCLRQPTQRAQCLSASVATAKSSYPEPTKEGEGKEDEHGATEALRLLNVRQLVRPLGGGRECPACLGSLNFEAAFKCSVCLQVVHVRCLRPKLFTKGNIPIYSSACNRCS